MSGEIALCLSPETGHPQENVTAKIGLILSFSLILIWGARKPVVRIGRIAGQYAKPRSSPMEKVGDRMVPSFRWVAISVPLSEFRLRICISGATMSTGMFYVLYRLLHPY